ncbi:hypothetical protein EYF80_012628 [Liparis tanakae]|uniref:Uncharacterized protein n=1 Tax=Liparis tanakae TaxID=230148 RepID=A0A4Z2IGL1_9TELE|nr:hypothetical protein EYF80_012628 [Liparis tanakae]
MIDGDDGEWQGRTVTERKQETDEGVCGAVTVCCGGQGLADWAQKGHSRASDWKRVVGVSDDCRDVSFNRCQELQAHCPPCAFLSSTAVVSRRPRPMRVRPRVLPTATPASVSPAETRFVQSPAGVIGTVFPLVRCQVVREDRPRNAKLLQLISQNGRLEHPGPYHESDSQDGSDSVEVGVLEHRGRVRVGGVVGSRGSSP